MNEGIGMSRYCALAGDRALIKSVDSVSQTLAPARALRGGTLCAGERSVRGIQFPYICHPPLNHLNRRIDMNRNGPCMVYGVMARALGTYNLYPAVKRRSPEPYRAKSTIVIVSQ